MSSSNPTHDQSHSTWHVFFSEVIRLILAPLILLSSGFFTASFLLSGRYSWPQTSRVFVLTVTIVVLTYEFVYKEQRARAATHERAMWIVLYWCVLPYSIGALVLFVLARLAA